MPWAAAAIAGSAVVGAVASNSASKSSAAAAKSAASTDQQAAQLQQQQYDTTRADLLPYNTTGQAALGKINDNLYGYSSPDQTYVGWAGDNYAAQQQYASDAQGLFDRASQIGQGPGGQAALEATPGYQFNLAQGLQAAQNSAAARGLGVSGAALKGAASYATGLADSTYQNQFANAMAYAQATQGTANQFGNIGNNMLALNTASQGNITNSYNKLAGIAGLGENAAAQTGTQGTALANQAGQNLVQSGNSQMAAGNASAAGTLGIGSAASGAANNYLAYNYFNKLTQNGQPSGYPSSAAVTQATGDQPFV